MDFLMAVAKACAVFALGGILAGCSKPDVKVGFMGALSGRYVDLGSSGKNGALLAFEQAKESGSIGPGSQMLVVDDEQNARKAAEGLAEFDKLGVKAIVGPMISSIAVSLADKGAAMGMVFVSPTATTDELSGKDDGFFRVINAASDMGLASGKRLAQDGVGSVAVLYDESNPSYCDPWMAGFEKGLGPRASVLKIGFDGSKKPDFEDFAARALESKAERIALVGSSLDAAALVAKIRKASPSAKMHGAGWTGTERLLELAGSAAEGMVLEQYVDWSDPDYNAFAASYKKRFGLQAGYPSYKAYLAMKLILDSGAASLPVSEAKKALAGRPVGQGRLDPFGDYKGPAYFVEVKGKRFVPLP